uniref:Uncharacterized protein n=1 Tax=Opuntia streptacantha TaxID=393608 RepID=A0A7C9DLG7_OPUST
MAIIHFNNGLILHQWPLHLIGDSCENSNDVLTLTKPDDGEITDAELNAVLLIDQMGDCAWDGDQGLLHGFGLKLRRSRWGFSIRVRVAVIIGEEILDEVGHVDGRIHRRRRRRSRVSV